MADAFLLVPGTGGTKLLANGADIGYPVEMQLRALLLGYLRRPIGEIVELLSMEHRAGQIAPVRTSMRRSTEIVGGPVLELAYNQVGLKYHRFRYDWRADLRHSAQQLLDRLIAEKPGGGRWRIVAHSQGGLLLVIASKLHAQRVGDDAGNAFSRLVRSVVLVGVPLHGTINAASALALGEQLGESASSQFASVIRSWPAIYQMLPDFENGLRRPNGSNATTGLLHAASWSANGGLSEDLLNRALQVHRTFLRHPFAYLRDVRVALVLSTNRPTREFATLTTRGLAFPAPGGRGDTLVPFAATTRSMGAAEKRTLVELASDRARNIGVHSMLLTDPYVGTLLSRAEAVI